jgi:hypothetical protein
MHINNALIYIDLQYIYGKLFCGIPVAFFKLHSKMALEKEKT